MLATIEVVKLLATTEITENSGQTRSCMKFRPQQKLCKMLAITEVVYHQSSDSNIEYMAPALCAEENGLRETSKSVTRKKSQGSSVTLQCQRGMRATGEVQIVIT